jgi:CheY-like chemotaxis protein
MPPVLPANIVERAQQVGILSIEQIRECWDELGSRNIASDDLVRILQRKGYLTPYQISKLEKAETSGFFYGGNKVLYKVASGGFARVYRGINTQTGEPVAIKVLRQRWTSDKASVDAFYHEGKVGQRLRHPNIVRIDEVGGHEATHYITMEFVEGGNLRDFLLIRGGRLVRDESIQLMLDALHGLAYAFDQGVTHRDIKLTNLLASTGGKLKLVDFGLASVHKDDRRAEEAHGQRTVEYALLEKTTGVAKGDPRSDIFFLGAVFYQMVSGTPPIPEKRDRAARMLRTRIDNIRPVREVNPGVDPHLAAVIDRMMSLNVRDRFQNPHEVIDSLRAAPGSAALAATPAAEPVAPSPAPPPRQAADRSVLFLEADTSLQDAVREKLHTLGYRVLITTDPRRGADRFKERPADCVVVDCETTGKPGLAAFQEMAHWSKNQKRPFAGVLLLTPEQSPWADQMERSDHVVALTKPVTMRDLRAQVMRLAPLPEKV